MKARRFLPWLLLVLAVLVASCSATGKPRTLVPVVAAERPLPAGSEFDPKPPEAGTGKEDCDPTASLRPAGLSVPAGSAMDRIRKRGRLIVGVDQNTYLFGFRDPATGKLEGFDIDIARQIAARLLGDEDKVQFRTMPIDQRIDRLKDGTVDIVVFTMTINCERRKEIEFSSVYFEASQRLLVLKASGYQSLADLEGKRVCAPAGTTSLANLAKAKPKVRLVAAVDVADCLLMLQQRQVDAYSTDDTVLAGMARQDPTTEVVGETFSAEPYGIGIPKDQPEMVRYVNAVLEDVRADNWRDIYNQWLQPVLGPASPPAPKYK